MSVKVVGWVGSWVLLCILEVHWFHVLSGKSLFYEVTFLDTNYITHLSASRLINKVFWCFPAFMNFSVPGFLLVRLRKLLYWLGFWYAVEVPGCVCVGALEVSGSWRVLRYEIKVVYQVPWSPSQDQMARCWCVGRVTGKGVWVSGCLGVWVSLPKGCVGVKRTDSLHILHPLESCVFVIVCVLLYLTVSYW